MLVLWDGCNGLQACNDTSVSKKIVQYTHWGMLWHCSRGRASGTGVYSKQSKRTIQYTHWGMLWVLWVLQVGKSFRYIISLCFRLLHPLFWPTSLLSFGVSMFYKFLGDLSLLLKTSFAKISQLSPHGAYGYHYHSD